jgi:hypothetical protein
MVFSSCVGVSASAIVSADGSVALKVSFAVSPSVESLLAADPEAFGLFIPLNESLARERATAVSEAIPSGTRFASSRVSAFRPTKDYGRTRIEAEFAFASLEAMRLYFDRTSAVIAVSRGARSSITITVSRGGASTRSEFANLFTLTDPDLRIELLVRVPGRVLDSTPAKPTTRVDEVRFSIDVTSLLSSGAPLVWNVVW